MKGLLRYETLLNVHVFTPVSKYLEVIFNKHKVYKKGVEELPDKMRWISGLIAGLEKELQNLWPMHKVWSFTACICRQFRWIE